MIWEAIALFLVGKRRPAGTRNTLPLVGNQHGLWVGSQNRPNTRFAT